MNRHILMVIEHQLNPDKYTQQELDKNAASAAAAATSAADAATASAAAAATYWLNEYFKISGENKQDYIDAINKDK